MDLRRQIVLVRRHLPLLVLSVILGAAAAFGLTSLQHKMYEARATLIVGQSLSSNPDYDQILASQRLSTTYASIATTKPVLAAVIKQLNLDMTPDQLLQRVRADAASDSSLLTISVQDDVPAQASSIANAIATQLLSTSPTVAGEKTALEQAVDKNLASTQSEIAEVSDNIAALMDLTNRTPAQDTELQALQARLTSLRSFYAALLPYSSADASNTLGVIDPATTPADPVSPNRWLNVLIGAILGLLVAAGFVSIAEYLDDTVKDADGVAAIARMSTIATLPLNRQERGRSPIRVLTTLLHPHSPAAEAYRTLRTNLGFASIDRKFRTLLVASSLPEEGKTDVAANLAVAFAEAGKQVLLVDADLRKPTLHEIFVLENAEGLTTLLVNDDATIDTVAQYTEVEHLRVLTSGPIPPNPLELVGSDRMHTIIGRLSTAADVVIFDSPPLAVVADAAILSAYLDGTLFVILSGRTHSRSVAQSREALERAGAKVLGAVLNGYRPEQADHYGDYYGGYLRKDRSQDQPVEASQPSAYRSGR